jgi:hypothetical protein
MRLLVCSFLLIACSNTGGGTNSTTGGTTGGVIKDMTVGPMSQCGHPGDVGNSKGVGAFCTHVSDCKGSANICSSLGNGANPSASDTYFCTIYPCMPDAGTGECGENAECICSTGSGGQGGCACTPVSCK